MPTKTIPNAKNPKNTAGVIVDLHARRRTGDLECDEQHEQDTEDRESVEDEVRHQVTGLLVEVARAQLAARPRQVLEVLLGDRTEGGDADQRQAGEHDAACRRAPART